MSNVGRKLLDHGFQEFVRAVEFADRPGRPTNNFLNPRTGGLFNFHVQAVGYVFLLKLRRRVRIFPGSAVESAFQEKLRRRVVVR